MDEVPPPFSSEKASELPESNQSEERPSWFLHNISAGAGAGAGTGAGVGVSAGVCWWYRFCCSQT